MRWRLRHENHKHIFLGIDSEGGAPSTRPIHLTDGSLHRAYTGLATNSESQSESETRSRQIIWSRHHARPRADMVRAHISHGLRAEISPSVQRATLEHHLNEPRVVTYRGYHAPASGFPSLRDTGVVHYRIVADGSVVREWLGYQRLLGGICHVEGGVFHAERIKQPLLLELVKRFSRNYFDHPTEDVDRVAIVPSRTGLIGRGELGYAIGKLGIVDVTRKGVSIDISLLDQSLTKKAVGET